VSEFVQAGQGSLVRMLHERLRAREVWEAAHPEVAAAWNEALLEDHRRTQRLEFEATTRQHESRMPDRLRELGVPDTAIRALETWSDTPAWQQAGKFLEADTQFLVMLGTVGTGKTVAAARVLAWALRQNMECHFLRATTLARLSGYEDKSFFDRLCWAPVVVLDDYGTEHLHGFAQSLFNEWLDCRYARASHRTVITANLQLEEFKGRIGERAVDRIREVGMVHIGKGSSMRERAKP
jgi:DNA replication protein DnaC